MGFATLYSPPINASEKAVIVRDAWNAELQEYVIGTVVSSNGPVSVWDKDEDKRLWGPGPYYDAVKFVELKGAEAVLRALGLETT